MRKLIALEKNVTQGELILVLLAAFALLGAGAFAQHSAFRGQANQLGSLKTDVRALQIQQQALKDTTETTQATILKNQQEIKDAILGLKTDIEELHGIKKK